MRRVVHSISLGQGEAGETRELNLSIEELLFVIKGGRTLLFFTKNEFYYIEIIPDFFQLLFLFITWYKKKRFTYQVQNILPPAMCFAS